MMFETAKYYPPNRRRFILGRDAFVRDTADAWMIPPAEQAPDDILEERIPFEMWPTKIDRELARLGVRTWRDLAGLSPREILIRTNLGQVSVRWIKNRMSMAGVGFDASQPRPIPCRVIDLKPVCGVYFVRCGEFVKIGSASNVRKRTQNLSEGIPFTLEPLGWVRAVDRDTAYALERALHKKFAAQRYHFEWFRYCPAIRAFIATHTGKMLDVSAAA